MIPEVRTSIDVVENPNVSPSLQEGSVSVQINGVGVGLAAALATAMEETARQVINEQNGREVLKAFLPSLQAEAPRAAPPPASVYEARYAAALQMLRSVVRVETVEVTNEERIGIDVVPVRGDGKNSSYSYGKRGPVRVIIVRPEGP